MDRPNAMATISTGKVMSIAPTGTKPSTPASQPSWKISLIAPKEADSDSRFNTSDLSGTNTDPNARNSARNATTATNSTIHGRREVTMSTMSTREAGIPVNDTTAPAG